MTTTLTSVPGGAEATVHIRESGLDSPPEHVHFDVDVPGLRAACFSLDRDELAAAFAEEADFTIVDNRQLPEVDGDEFTMTPHYGRMGWTVGRDDLTREVVIERLQELIPAYVALLRHHEQKIVEKKGAQAVAELDAIERFVCENGAGKARHLADLVHALHEKGFRP